MVTLAGGPLLRARRVLERALQLSVPMGRASLAPLFARVQSPPVPELPDLDVVADALHAALAGRPVAGARALMPLAVRGTPARAGALWASGSRASRARASSSTSTSTRSGGREPDAHRSVPACRPGREGAVRHGRGAGARSRGRRAAGRRGRVDAGGRLAPAATRAVILRYRDPTQMGKVYLLPAGVERPSRAAVAGEMGPDALDPALTLDVWRERIRKPPGRAQEPAPQPGVRGGDRQRLLGRDPVRGAPPALPQALVPRRRGDRRPVRRHARDAGGVRRASCGSACRRPSRSRSATTWPSTTAAASHARGAARGSRR